MLNYLKWAGIWIVGITIAGLGIALKIANSRVKSAELMAKNYEQENLKFKKTLDIWEDAKKQELKIREKMNIISDEELEVRNELKYAKTTEEKYDILNNFQSKVVQKVNKK